MFAYYPTRKVNVMVKGQAELASGEFVSGDYFRGLAVPPAAGRLIIPDDDRAGAPPIAVLSFAFSQRRFGDAASAPGQSILINNVPFTVAGVAPPGFFGVDPAAAPDFYIPLHTNFLLQQRARRTTGQGLSRAELLLDRNDGAPASGRQPDASAGRAGPGVSPMGREPRRPTIASARTFRNCCSGKARPDSIRCGGSTRNPCTCCWRWWG